MPYLITVKRLPEGGPNVPGWRESKRAVEALKGREIWNALYGVDIPRREDVVDEIEALGPRGGTLGPLADGSMVEVQSKVWKWFYDHSGGRLLRPVTECTKASILAAFNEAQAA